MNNQRTGSFAALAALVVVALLALVVLPIYVMALSSSESASNSGSVGGLATGSVPAEYQQAVLSAGSKCPQIPPSLIAAQIEAESQWNPRAVSPVGAQGIAQFMPATWRTWGKDVNNDGKADPFDPIDAIDAQGRFMCALAAQMQALISRGAASGNVQDLALAAYNAGPGAVQQARGVPAFAETQAYVRRIRQLMTTKYSSTQPITAGPSSGVVAAARRWMNYPYVWGGGGTNGPSGIGRDGRGPGFDCSGLTQYGIFHALGIELPRTADTQIKDARGLDINPDHSLAAAKPGDLIAFSKNNGRTYHHIGIYAGNGMMLHAPSTGKNVQIVNLARSVYWGKQTWKIKRFSRAS